MRSAALVLFLASLAAIPAAHAQEAQSPTPDAAETAPQAAAPASPAEIPTSRDQVAEGEPYRRAVFSDWMVRCIKVAQPADVCEMHQSLVDQDGTRTAEFNLFPLQQGEVVAAGTIVTPLETLLTQGISITVDSNEGRRYPFTFCNRVGCVSQVGFTAAELDAFRRGAVARITIVPLAAPDREVILNASLSGFTAAFEDVGQRGAAPE